MKKIIYLITICFLFIFNFCFCMENKKSGNDNKINSFHVKITELKNIIQEIEKNNCELEKENIKLEIINDDFSKKIAALQDANNQAEIINMKNQRLLKKKLKKEESSCF